jgi:hypothetical protein
MFQRYSPEKSSLVRSCQASLVRRDFLNAGGPSPYLLGHSNARALTAMPVSFTPHNKVELVACFHDIDLRLKVEVTPAAAEALLPHEVRTVKDVLRLSVVPGSSSQGPPTFSCSHNMCRRQSRRKTDELSSHPDSP